MFDMYLELRKVLLCKRKGILIYMTLKKSLFPWQKHNIIRKMYLTDKY